MFYCMYLDIQIIQVKHDSYNIDLQLFYEAYVHGYQIIYSAH
jgi:hypothetical protein